MTLPTEAEMWHSLLCEKPAPECRQMHEQSEDLNPPGFDETDAETPESGHFAENRGP